MAMPTSWILPHAQTFNLRSDIRLQGVKDPPAVPWRPDRQREGQGQWTHRSSLDGPGIPYLVAEIHGCVVCCEVRSVHGRVFSGAHHNQFGLSPS